MSKKHKKRWDAIPAPVCPPVQYNPKLLPEPRRRLVRRMTCEEFVNQRLAERSWNTYVNPVMGIATRIETSLAKWFYRATEKQDPQPDEMDCSQMLAGMLQSRMETLMSIEGDYKTLKDLP